MKLRLAIASLSCVLTPLFADDLERAFVTPPEDTKPRCYWYWQDGHVTANGITKDLESMTRVGIGGAYIGIIGGGEFKWLSEPWWQMVDHAIAEGGRTKVNIGLFNCPGGSQSGGPWVKSSQFMRYLVLPAMRLKGPQRFQGKRPFPAGKAGDFQPVALLAFPEPAAGDLILGRTVAATVAGTPPAKNLEALVDGDPKTSPTLVQSQGAFALTLTAPLLFTARRLTVMPAAAYYGRVQLEVDDGGQGWKTVGALMVERNNLDVNDGPVPLAPAGFDFTPVTGTRFRLLIDRYDGNVAVGEVALQAVEHVAEKQLQKIGGGAQPSPSHAIWQTPQRLDEATQAINATSVIDLKSKVAPDGTLTWEVPAGKWVLQSAGMLPTCKSNTPAPPEGTGPEVDKLNASAVRDHFNAYMGVALSRLKTPQARHALRYPIADSYPAQRSAPQSLKGYNDWAYTEGIDQFVFHVYYEQADTDGQGINGWGTSFHRNNTWFGQMGA
jgi:hypothetical protein